MKKHMPSDSMDFIDLILRIWKGKFILGVIVALSFLTTFSFIKISSLKPIEAKIIIFESLFFTNFGEQIDWKNVNAREKGWEIDELGGNGSIMLSTSDTISSNAISSNDFIAYFKKKMLEIEKEKLSVIRLEINHINTMPDIFKNSDFIAKQYHSLTKARDAWSILKKDLTNEKNYELTETTLSNEINKTNLFLGVSVLLGFAFGCAVILIRDEIISRSNRLNKAP